MRKLLRTGGGVLGSLAIVGAGAGLAYGVAALVDESSRGNEAVTQFTASHTPNGGSVPVATSSEQETPSRTQEPSQYVGGLLRSSNRSELAICVQAIGFPDTEQIESEAVQDVAVGMARAMQQPLWDDIASQGTFGPSPSPDLVTATPEVASGCPAEPAALDPQAGPVVGEYVTENLGRVVQHSSRYLFHVFVFPDDEILRIVGDSQNLHSGIEEKICDVDVCSPVTIGLYFSPEELKTTTLVDREIGFVIGLR
jgi:hypothetical protein